ncbi:MAG: AAA family ATPase [Endozoicomonadaceae bacterium]|nr:AAA family ATPase [Endozoicomonadaceae bacterium]
MAIAECFESAADFERFIGLEYERMGFDVQLNDKKNEPGYDFLAIKGKRLIAVQVKNYKKKIPINVVLKFRDYMDRSGIKEGAIISSKGFSTPAISAIAAQKLKNFHMGHFSDHEKKIVWDYVNIGITAPVEKIKKPHYISVFTAKGGVGKTVVSAHLAGAFALSGYKVNIVDGDPEENLYRLTGNKATVPDSRTGRSNIVNVAKMSDWNENNTNQETITVFDCSPALERNNLALLKKTESFIIPSSLSPLEIGNKAEVLIRSINQIREHNKKASIFILMNKYFAPNEKMLDRFQEIKKIIINLNNKNCVILDPEDVSIRESKLLRNWGSEPDLAFKTVGGRCYPRDDFLNLTEHLLERLDISQD